MAHWPLHHVIEINIFKDITDLAVDTDIATLYIKTFCSI